MKYLIILSILLSFTFSACSESTDIKIKIKTNLNEKSSKPVSMDVSNLSNSNVKKISAFDGDVEIPSQLVDSNADGKFDIFSFLVNLEPNQTKFITLKEISDKKKFEQLAHAEISEKKNYKFIDGVYTAGEYVSVKKTKTPEGHIDHNLFYKAEGPCWESNLVGYRFYLDQRNATDIFGKKTNEMVLPRIVGKKNLKYHEMADWGMDIFKVGKSLGIGSFAAYANNKVEMVYETDSIICVIPNDGPIMATVNTKYYGWKFSNQKINLDITLTIVADSRLTKCDANVNGNPSSYCSGIAKHTDTEYVESNVDGWNYIALWGKQTVINDNLGIALFYKKKETTKIVEDELNYIVTFAPDKNNNIEYYYAACWKQEPNGIKTKDEFVNYLTNVIKELNNPLEAKIVN